MLFNLDEFGEQARSLHQLTEQKKMLTIDKNFREHQKEHSCTSDGKS
jgi:hypothetical protein